MHPTCLPRTNPQHFTPLLHLCTPILCHSELAANILPLLFQICNNPICTLLIAIQDPSQTLPFLHFNKPVSIPICTRCHKDPPPTICIKPIMHPLVCHSGTNPKHITPFFTSNPSTKYTPPRLHFRTDPNISFLIVGMGGNRLWWLLC